MLTRSFGIGAALCALSLSACILGGEKDPPTVAGRYGNRLEGLPPSALLDSSQKAFGWMKAMSGNSYTYRQTWSSPIGGNRGHADVTVREGAIMRYAIQEEGIGSASQSVYDSLGVAMMPEGMAPVVLDSIYARCRVSLSAEPGPTVHFEVWLDGNYILRACGYRDDRMMDGDAVTRLEMQNWQWK